MLHVDGLENRVAVVTGAARGIGRRIAETLHENGARVAGFDLDPPGDEWALGIACDVTDEQAVDRSFREVEAQLGTVSVLVLNAGIYPVVPFAETSAELWRRTLDVNLTGAFLCARRAVEKMREQR
ncbi:MAG TPA: SDR family NAD(P)-dependent oxidoreductase, partial [Acidimicrobiales bacterium]|nr:SDR family NAD(P)-dependent oxidoreductase [Acidimicrobiales bacterium]